MSLNMKRTIQITESKYHCNFDENLMQKWTSLLQVELLLIYASYD